MKNKLKILSLSLVFLVGTALCLHLLGEPAWAEEEAGDWRKTYDMIMLWVNFGILAFVLVKFGKNPLMGFLRMQRDEVAAEIDDLEKEKALVTEKIEDAKKALAESDVRFADMKKAIVRMGERRRQELIEDAKKESGFMMDLAHQKVGGYIMAAKRAFKEQLIDASVNLALSRLPDQMTEAYNQRLVNQYLSTVTENVK
jgi:F-type H+-transporting ATPase subunit b